MISITEQNRDTLRRVTSAIVTGRGEPAEHAGEVYCRLSSYFSRWEERLETANGRTSELNPHSDLSHSDQFRAHAVKAMRPERVIQIAGLMSAAARIDERFRYSKHVSEFADELTRKESSKAQRNAKRAEEEYINKISRAELYSGLYWLNEREPDAVSLIKRWANKVPNASETERVHRFRALKKLRRFILKG